MKYWIGLFTAAFLALPAASQNTVKMSAVKSNDYGVAYSLPKTSIAVRVTVTKKTRKAGEFYRFAERYLNISNPITEDEVIYTLDNIEAVTTGIPDREESYLVEFKSNSTAPFVTLTRDGVICAINADISVPDTDLFPALPEQKTIPVPDPRMYLSEEILRAGSTAKQAELIAKQIYRLRESKTDILTGESDNMPPDGNAYQLVMSQIDEQEKALTSMFGGTDQTEVSTQVFNIIPNYDDINREVFFRFSSRLGIVAANDLAGEPVYVTLTNKEPRQEVILSAKEQKAWDEKFSKGIIYNVPAKANLKIEFDNKVIVQKECDIVQFGTQEVLTPKQLEYKKDAPVKIIFYPDLGAIKEISQ